MVPVFSAFINPGRDVSQLYGRLGYPGAGCIKKVLKKLTMISGNFNQ